MMILDLTSRAVLRVMRKGDARLISKYPAVACFLLQFVQLTPQDVATYRKLGIAFCTVRNP